MHSMSRQLGSSVTNTSRQVTTLSGAIPAVARVRRPNKYANDTAKAGGDISDAFTSMSGALAELPPRYISLKRELVPTSKEREVTCIWRDVLREVATLTETIRHKKGSVSPLDLSWYYYGGSH